MPGRGRERGQGRPCCGRPQSAQPALGPGRRRLRRAPTSDRALPPSLVLAGAACQRACPLPPGRRRCWATCGAWGACWACRRRATRPPTRCRCGGVWGYRGAALMAGLPQGRAALPQRRADGRPSCGHSRRSCAATARRQPALPARPRPAHPPPALRLPPPAASPSCHRRQARVDGAVASVPEASPAQRPSVAMLEWVDPIFMGGHWTPQLVEMAGGRHPMNPCKRVGGSSRRRAAARSAKAPGSEPSPASAAPGRRGPRPPHSRASTAAVPWHAAEPQALSGAAWPPSFLCLAGTAAGPPTPPPCPRRPWPTRTPTG